MFMWFIYEANYVYVVHLRSKLCLCGSFTKQTYQIFFQNAFQLIPYIRQLWETRTKDVLIQVCYNTQFVLFQNVEIVIKDCFVFYLRFTLHTTS